MKNQIKTKAYADVHLLQREYHNRNAFKLQFIRMVQAETYILKAGKPLGPSIAFCEPDELIYLPHGYYYVFGIDKDGRKIPDGEPINVLMNLEKAMFKGNKTPSNQYGLDQ